MTILPARLPVDIPGAAVASIGIMSHDVHKQTREANSFLWTISSLMSLFFANKFDKIPEFTLTSRQLEILTLISNNYTNHDIAEELGYSDSTIRHETMKIYEILKVTGRKEAVAKGIALKLIKNK